MSAEPNRKKAYSPDSRWRVVYQRLGMGLSYSKISTNLNIALSTAHRTFSLFERTGRVDPSKDVIDPWVVPFGHSIFKKLELV